jgi:hypothetical protein
MKIVLNTEEVKSILCDWMVKNNHVKKNEIKELKIDVYEYEKKIEFALILLQHD